MGQGMSASVEWSKTWTFFQGDWHEGNPPILGPRTHGMWMASVVFDGARAFEGVTPDLDLHCARVNESARRVGLAPCVSAADWLALAAEGCRRFSRDAELYIRPMYWAEQGDLTGIVPQAASTRFCLCLYEAPLPRSGGMAVTLSPFRRPTIETMPVDAKAACLYPNNARALTEAARRGFDNCLLCDMLGNVAELASANIFMAKQGIVHTPAANGTFLAGITRNRTIRLLRDAGVTVLERTLRYDDFVEADEIFSTGNYAKVRPVIRIDDRALAPGPLYEKARALYWEFAHAGPAGGIN